MKFGYTILYVDDVPETLRAWREAFELSIAYTHEDTIYGELATGETTLAFAETAFGRSHFEDEATRAMFDGAPRRFEVGLVTEDVEAAYARALSSGMGAVRPPFQQPWGQTVCWVSDANGILIELSSPMD
ncbi:MAG: VOC family protein [Myxococcota bacterium]